MNLLSFFYYDYYNPVKHLYDYIGKLIVSEFKLSDAATIKVMAALPHDP